MRNIYRMVLTAISLAPIGPYVSAAEIIVDAFDQMGQLVNTNSSTAAHNESTVTGLGPLGYERFLQLRTVKVDGRAAACILYDGTCDSNGANGEAGLRIVIPAGESSNVNVTWAGYEAVGLNNRILDFGDITGGGTNQGLLVGVPTQIVGAMNLQFDLVSGTEQTSTATLKKELPGGFSDGVGLFFAFDDFARDAEFDLTELFSITMSIVLPTSGEPASHEGLNALLTFVTATADPNADPLPLPATFPLISIGLAGLTFARRRLSKRPLRRPHYCISQ